VARITADKLHPKARAIVDQIAALPQLPVMTPVEARGDLRLRLPAPEAVQIRSRPHPKRWGA